MDIVKEKSVCIINPKSIGQSPLFKRLYERFRTEVDTENLERIVYMHCSENDNEPFAFVKRLFSKLGLHTNIIPTEEAEGNVITDSVDSIVTALARR